MSIPRNFIQTVLDRTDIIDVIGSRVPIKKKGSSYFACCPFHQEKSGSFHISPQKQFYHCFGCGVHGNAITFLREYDGLDFVEAIETLARSLGLDVPYERQAEPLPEVSANQSSVYEVLKQASRFYQWQLRHHEQADQVVSYLKQRQVSGKTAKKFGLGFAPNAWDGLIKQIGRSPVELGALVSAGLVIKNDQNRYYDRFRNRLMFPILDRKGQVVGFGGRVLSADQEPKYLNSPETDVFHKGSILYGLYELKQERSALDFILIVEGYMDVVMLSEYGILNAVATLGTAATTEHMKQLFRHADHLVFCFDGDRAGQEAAKRAVKVVLPFMHSAHRSVKFLFLPEVDDPDSFVRAHGTQAFLAQVQISKPLLDFVWDLLIEGLDLNLLNDRARCVERGLVYCKLLPEGVYRTMMVNQLALYSRWTVQQIMTALNQEEIENNQIKVVTSEAIRHFSPKLVDSLMMRAIRCLCEDPGLALIIEPLNLVEKSEEIELFKELFQACRQFDRPTFPMVLQTLKKEFTEKLVEIAHQSPHVSIDQEGFLELCHKLLQKDLEYQVKILIEKSKKGGLSPEEKVFLRETLQQKQSIKSVE